MELGQRLKQARLEAGLSQRQLCGDTITRNMLSQIENGSARPSMDTLKILAARLGKPMGYFLEEQAITSPNQAVMAAAREAKGAEALEILKGYRAPDVTFDREKYYLEALCAMAAAEQALEQGKPGLAAALLERAGQAGEQTPYYTPETEQRRVLLCHRAKVHPAAALAALLPDNTEELLLRAEAALEDGQPEKAQALLKCAPRQPVRWHALQAELYFSQKEYALAAREYLLCGDSPALYPRLEACYKHLRDFEKAYYYACKQR